MKRREEIIAQREANRLALEARRLDNAEAESRAEAYRAANPLRHAPTAYDR